MIDIARKTKQPLYILFVDYVKAYDRVDRNTLLQHLCEAGCGRRFLQAIGKTLEQTYSELGSATFHSSMGVRQGGSTSCSLFTFYINKTIRAIKAFGSDGWLEHLHSILLMDDTTLLATSRQAIQHKLELLLDSTSQLNMKLHPSKSKFMTVNATDNTPLTIQDVTISHTELYIYLGSPIENAPIAHHVEQHVQTKQSHVRKFSSFLAKNEDAPFSIKFKTWEAALRSTLLYGCESWLTNDMQAIEQPYVRTLKELLSVRQQTCTDLVYVELAMGNAKSVIQHRQITFLKKKKLVPGFELSLLGKTIAKAQYLKSPMGKYITQLLAKADPVVQDLQTRQQSVIESESSRRTSYVELNPELQKHEVYSSSLPEHHRIAFTRFRLSSHRLAYEMGRWSRTPASDRLCVCGSTQSSSHVLIDCPTTNTLRSNCVSLDFVNIAHLMKSKDSAMLCKYIYDVLKLFDT